MTPLSQAAVTPSWVFTLWLRWHLKKYLLLLPPERRVSGTSAGRAPQGPAAPLCAPRSSLRTKSLSQALGCAERFGGEGAEHAEQQPAAEPPPQDAGRNLPLGALNGAERGGVYREKIFGPNTGKGKSTAGGADTCPAVFSALVIGEPIAEVPPELSRAARPEHGAGPPRAGPPRAPPAAGAEPSGSRGDAQGSARRGRAPGSGPPPTPLGRARGGDAGTRAGGRGLAAGPAPGRGQRGPCRGGAAAKLRRPRGGGGHGRAALGGARPAAEPQRRQTGLGRRPPQE
ncbi:hypothetical protein LUU34_01321700 [Aix galericulata]|nr:hypothetical protein LUU34_01321700 [Aix galericulata]